MVYRLNTERAEEELRKLWEREMFTGVYDARLLPCQTARGSVPALAFTLSRRSESCVPHLCDEQLLHILRHARGRCGTTLDYVANTAHALRQHGVRDREIERLMHLAAHHGLLSQEPVARKAWRSSTVSTSTSTPASSSSTAHAG